MHVTSQRLTYVYKVVEPVQLVSVTESMLVQRSLTKECHFVMVKLRSIMCTYLWPFQTCITFVSSFTRSKLMDILTASDNMPIRSKFSDLQLQ